MRYKNTIEAFCETFIFIYDAQANCRYTRDFVLTQIARMPDLFRFVFNLITLFFILSVFFSYGKTFDKLAKIQRIQIITKWKNSKLVLCRDFIRFFETFVLFEIVTVPRGVK